MRSVTVWIVCVLATFAIRGTAQTVTDADLHGLRGRIVPLTPCYAGSMTCGSSRSGRVSVDSCESGGVYGVGYSFNGTAGTRVTITGRSPEFAATIALADGRSGNSTIYARHDVYNDGATARIENFVLPYTGPYLILITPGVRYEFGDYTLTLSCPGSGPVTCTQSPTVTCLVGGRFQVSTTYFNPVSGMTNTFQVSKQDPFAVSPDVALFGFDDPRAIELVVRIVDARPFDNHYHVYYGGLTDFPFTVRITDTAKNITKEYRFNGGTPAGGVDRLTFSTP